MVTPSLYTHPKPNLHVQPNKQHSLVEYFFCDGNYDCDSTLIEFCNDVSNAETKVVLRLPLYIHL